MAPGRRLAFDAQRARHNGALFSYFERIALTVAKHKRSVWEELLEMGRRILKEIDDLLDPRAPQPRKPARVPVPAGKRRREYDRE